MQAALEARKVSVKPVTVRSWALPGRSIPAKYWTPIVEIARERGVPASYDDLAASVAVDPSEAA